MVCLWEQKRQIKTPPSNTCIITWYHRRRGHSFHFNNVHGQDWYMLLLGFDCEALSVDKVHILTKMLEGDHWTFVQDFTENVRKEKNWSLVLLYAVWTTMMNPCVVFVNPWMVLSLSTSGFIGNQDYVVKKITSSMKRTCLSCLERYCTIIMCWHLSISRRQT